MTIIELQTIRSKEFWPLPRRNIPPQDKTDISQRIRESYFIPIDQVKSVANDQHIARIGISMNGDKRCRLKIAGLSLQCMERRGNF